MSRTLFAALLFALPACDTSTCNTIPSDVSDMCVPATVAADRQVTIEVRELCGKGCSHPPSCNALLRNGQVTLDVNYELCTETTYYQCIALGCLQRSTRCTLPALPAGDYALTAPGGAAQLLRVRADGETSCRFPGSPDGGV